jgi:HPt (histidine-containing phosphotransfer) domain-containing protein
MDDYLSKPLNPDKLKPVLKYWLQEFPPPSEAFLRLSLTDEGSQAPGVAPLLEEKSFSGEKGVRPLLTVAIPSANSSSPPSIPSLFDLTEALTRVGGDRELLGELAEIFLESCPAYLANIRKALEQEDVQALSLAAHALKGSVGNFTKSGPFETARALEHLGRQGTMAGAGELFQQLEKEIISLQPALESLRLEAAA